MKRWLFPLFAVIAMLAPAPVCAAYDTSGHWAEELINHSINQGYIKGYEDGSFRPDNPIKRAEFVSLANKSMGFSRRGGATFYDVNMTDWFYDDVSIAQAEGYISGFTDGTFRPNDVITRETAAVMAANMLHLNDNQEYASYFTDSGSLSWSKGFVGAAVKAKILSGYTDGSFNPKKALSRAEAVSLISRVSGKKYDTSLDIQSGYKSYYAGYDDYDSTYIPEDRRSYQDTGVTTSTSPDGGYYRLYNGNYGSASSREEFRAGIMYAPRYAGTVQNISVDGDFEVTSFVVPDSELTLDNVKITGRLIIYSIGKVTLKNCDIAKLEWHSVNKGSLVYATGNTVVEETRIFRSVKLTEEGLTNGRGFRSIIIDERCDSDVTAALYGDCYQIIVEGNKAKLVLEKGSVDIVEIAQKSSNCNIEVRKDAKVGFMDVLSSCYVEGYGIITLAKVSADNATFDLKPKSASGSKNPIYTSGAHDGAADGEKSGVYITVVDSTGARLSGVNVRLGAYGEKVTPADGMVYFEAVPAGTHDCVLSLPYISRETRTVTVTSSDTAFTLTYDSTERHTVTFTVRDGSTPLEKVTVSLQTVEGTFGKETDAYGTAEFTGVASGAIGYSLTYGGKTMQGSDTVSIVNSFILVDFSKIP